MSEPAREQWIRMTLRPLPSDVPTAVRLRKLLKAALRYYGFRLEEIEWLPPPPGKEKGETRS